jgi:hypothetical protein
MIRVPSLRSVTKAIQNFPLTSAFSARRRATTDPEEPDPQTIMSYCGFKAEVSPYLIVAHTFCKFCRYGVRSVCS